MEKSQPAADRSTFLCINYSLSTLQFRGCWRARSQDFGGRSARNPQEKIVAEISRGARRDRDPHRRPQPLPSAARAAHSIQQHTQTANSKAPLKSREPRAFFSFIHLPPPPLPFLASTLPACLLCFRSPARFPGSQPIDREACGGVVVVVVAAAEREPGSGRAATAAAAPARPVMPAVAVA